ncbi:MAG: MarR family transcriptional regulator [Acidimicrobiia bacterium]|nr:MarR family transcriptional regulator [Acidimicrobiia bacterium]
MVPSPTFDDDRFTRFGLLVDGFQQVSRALDQSLKANCDLSLAWFEVLLRLGRSAGHSLMMSELAAELGVTSGAVTRLIDRISAAGLVTREADEADRRVQWARLTPAGVKRVEVAAEVHLADLDREYFGRLTDRQGAVITRAFNDLRRPLDGQGQG